MILPTLEEMFAGAEVVRLQAQGYQKKTIISLKIGLVPSTRICPGLARTMLARLTHKVPARDLNHGPRSRLLMPELVAGIQPSLLK
jgi:hypothetical protein